MPSDSIGMQFWCDVSYEPISVGALVKDMRANWPAHDVLFIHWIDIAVHRELMEELSEYSQRVHDAAMERPGCMTLWSEGDAGPEGFSEMLAPDVLPDKEKGVIIVELMEKAAQ